jgi:hypothetical protein
MSIYIDPPRYWNHKHAIYKCLIFLITISAQLVMLPSRACAIEKGKTMIDVGLALGSKSGAVVGLKYFFMNDVAVCVDLIGAPSGRLHLGISAEVDYYPSLANEHAYLGLGLSFMHSIHEILQGERILPFQSSILALNLAIGLNTWVFQLPPVIESENKDNVPSVFYCELGPALILINSSWIDGVSADDNSKATYQRWLFPNLELGIRQGPFTPVAIP